MRRGRNTQFRGNNSGRGGGRPPIPKTPAWCVEYIEKARQVGLNARHDTYLHQMEMTATVEAAELWVAAVARDMQVRLKTFCSTMRSGLFYLQRVGAPVFSEAKVVAVGVGDNGLGEVQLEYLSVSAGTALLAEACRTFIVNNGYRAQSILENIPLFVSDTATRERVLTALNTKTLSCLTAKGSGGNHWVYGSSKREQSSVPVVRGRHDFAPMSNIGDYTKACENTGFTPFAPGPPPTFIRDGYLSYAKWASSINDGRMALTSTGAAPMAQNPATSSGSVGNYQVVLQAKFGPMPTVSDGGTQQFLLIAPMTLLPQLVQLLSGVSTEPIVQLTRWIVTLTSSHDAGAVISRIAMKQNEIVSGSELLRHACYNIIPYTASSVDSIEGVSSAEAPQPDDEDSTFGAPPTGHRYPLDEENRLLREQLEDMRAMMRTLTSQVNAAVAAKGESKA